MLNISMRAFDFLTTRYALPCCRNRPECTGIRTWAATATAPSTTPSTQHLQVDSSLVFFDRTFFAFFLQRARTSSIREAPLKDSNARATAERLNSRAQVRRRREVREQPLRPTHTDTGSAETHASAHRPRPRLRPTIACVRSCSCYAGVMPGRSASALSAI